MENVNGCPTCAALLEAVRIATERHIDTLGRLQRATIEHETETAKALALVVREAGAERERRTAAYRRHAALHRIRGCGVSA